MAQYPPPTETLPIFDASKFMHDTTSLTRTEADLLYVHYSTAQGEVIFPSIRVNGDTNTDTVTAVNIEAKDTITCTTLKYDILDPPVGGGSTGTLAQVLNTGNDAAALNMNNVGIITSTMLKVYNEAGIGQVRTNNLITYSDDGITATSEIASDGIMASMGYSLYGIQPTVFDITHQGNITCQELKYTTLNPPIEPGGIPTLTEVLSTGNNAGGFGINGLSTLVVENKAGINSLDVNDLNIVPIIGTPITITALGASTLNIPCDIVGATNISTVTNGQMNARAFVAGYEFAVVPDSQTETSNLILGSNNGNNYNLFQYNPVGGTNNQLQLQYQNNSIQPQTTKTLLNILPAGDIQLGYSTSPSPIVQISGSSGLGRVYDTIYNPIGASSTVYTGHCNINKPLVIVPGTYYNMGTITFPIPVTSVNCFISAMLLNGTLDTPTSPGAIQFILSRFANSPDPIEQIIYEVAFGATGATNVPFNYTLSYGNSPLVWNTTELSTTTLNLYAYMYNAGIPSAQITLTTAQVKLLVQYSNPGVSGALPIT